MPTDWSSVVRYLLSWRAVLPAVVALLVAGGPGVAASAVSSPLRVHRPVVAQQPVAARVVTAEVPAMRPAVRVARHRAITASGERLLAAAGGVRKGTATPIVAPAATAPPSTAPPGTAPRSTAPPGTAVTTTHRRVDAPVADPPTTTTTSRPSVSGWGCGPALTYLSAHAAPGFRFECPGYADGRQAMTCWNVSGLCPGEKLIAIAVACPAAYMNEASNSWVVTGRSDAPIDPYGYCP